MAGAFELLAPAVQRWIYHQGWSALRPAQERAVAPILGGEHDMVITASTAAGKTEAAFLPILSRLVSTPEEDQEQGCEVLYVAPLKALINDQFDRLELMTAGMDVALCRWHGDASQTAKQRFLRRPEGILQITPESLEAILVIHGNKIERLFATLRYVVVDELHAFIGNERGRQLQSLLHRIETGIHRRVPRIGLSATLGDTNLACQFLRPDGGLDTVVIQERGEGQEIKLQVRGYCSRVAELLPQLANQSEETESAPSTAAIAAHLFATLRGSSNLIFANQRRMVEELANRLRRRCDQLHLPNEFWPHHGSLARDLREQVEAELKRRSRPVNVVCTSTLEMGIDIGWVSSVAQVGVPPSVAAMRQRLGRSGRRGSAAVLRIYIQEQELDPKSSMADRLRVGLVQTMAMVELMLEGWIEPPRLEGLHLSTLIQQILSLIAQHGGAIAPGLWKVLCQTGPFSNIGQERFVALLRRMGKTGLLAQSPDGTLLHGELGERIVNHYSFYAAFKTSEEFTLMHGSRRLGSIPIDQPLQEGSYLVFAGRGWLVESVDTERRIISLKPAASGNPPIFGGSRGLVHDAVRARMRRIYESDHLPAYLDPSATDLLAEAREGYRRQAIGDRAVLREGNDLYWFTWRGDLVNDTLTALFEHAGLTARNEGPFVRAVDIREETAAWLLGCIAIEREMTGEQLARELLNKDVEKYDGFLDPELLSCGFAASRLDLAGAREWAASVLHV